MTDVTGRLRASLADRYHLEKEIGAGGMATVYVAHDVRHDVQGTSQATGSFIRVIPRWTDQARRLVRAAAK